MMKMSILPLVAFTALSGGALLAQDVSGTWQGTLHAVSDLRIVIRISNTEGGGLKATFYSVDQGGQPVGATSHGWVQP